MDFRKGFSDQVALLREFMQEHGLIDCELASGVPHAPHTGSP